MLDRRGRESSSFAPGLCGAAVATQYSCLAPRR